MKKARRYLTQEQKDEIYRKGHVAGYTHASIGYLYGVGATAVGNIIRKRQKDEKAACSGDAYVDLSLPVSNT